MLLFFFKLQTYPTGSFIFLSHTYKETLYMFPEGGRVTTDPDRWAKEE
jgi:hypothetical protein